MKRRYVGGAVCAAALMLVFACGVLRKSYFHVSEIGWVLQKNGGERDSWNTITVAETYVEDDELGRFLATRSAGGANRRTTLPKRGLLTSKEFKKAAERGKRILSSLDTPQQAEKQKQIFDNPSDLEAWGWTSTELTDESVKKTLANYAVPFKAKGLSVDSRTLRGVKVSHDRETVHDGVKYPATGGTYTLILDADQGLLVPSSSYSPSYYKQNRLGPSKNHPASSPLPKLQHWADIAFLTWQQHTTALNLESKKSLHYIAAINALNPATVQIAAEALRKDGVASGTPPSWPGHVFSRARAGPFSSGSEAFYAVLGTPNLLGSCWLVAALHHWEGEGGGKGVGIGAVTVFDSSGFANSEGGVQVSFLVEVV